MIINDLKVYIMANYPEQLGLCFLRARALCGLPLNRKYRSHFEIIATMLEAVKDDSIASFSIMRRASINSALLKKYLKSLSELDFIEMNIKKGRVLYRASEKGQEFLRQYHVLLGMLLTARTQNKSTNIDYEPEYVTPIKQQHSATQFTRKL